MKKYIIIASAILGFSVTACVQQPLNINDIVVHEGPTYTQPNASRKSKQNPFQLTVQTGDTLYSIAQKYEVSLRALIERNRLHPPYHLRPGQVLKLPKAQFHVIKEKDTLYSISQAYGVNLHQLASDNHLSAPYQLHPGEKLRLPHHNQESTMAESEPAPSAKKVAAAPTQKKTTRTVSPRDITPPTLRSSTKSKTTSRHASAKRLRFSWPSKGRIISNFGPKKGGLYNDGINIAAPNGSAIKAAEDGKVVYAGNELRGYGNLVLIKHDNGYLTAYAHASRLLVKNGTFVKKGQTIGEVGKTGHVNSPQLHFSIRKGRKALNPKKYLS